MADTDVVYTFRAEDKISEPMKKAEDQLNKTKEASDRCTDAQEKAILKSVEVMTALHAVQSGLSAVTSSVKTLGLVDEETALTLQKVTAGIQLVVGTAQAIKGVVTLFQTLNAVHGHRIDIRSHRREPRQGCAHSRCGRIGGWSGRRVPLLGDAE